MIYLSEELYTGVRVKEEAAGGNGGASCEGVRGGWWQTVTT